MTGGPQPLQQRPATRLPRLWSAQGVSTGRDAGAHAGWVGLLAGVRGRTVEHMRALGATDVRAVLGPCIRVECYEFGPDDLDRVAARLGDGVRSTTASGTPALDLAAGVRASL